MKITEGCIVLMADNIETQELREQLYQARQMMKGMQDALVWCSERSGKISTGKLAVPITRGRCAVSARRARADEAHRVHRCQTGF
ncbi:hypothetical protein MUU47_08905 [Scandinavium sp. H11S7]|uniref:Uncharacterized protein n=1 Tax=Scandinavium hiltneri TaxID=2926519 RepID=A0ABT2E051_9ENTR|nr:hypothetical protein [Scandinavium hiltneri]MCS2161239.1 hypothetical protein [Scandinavium hiltneri]